jgi:hypothetical protein
VVTALLEQLLEHSDIGEIVFNDEYGHRHFDTGIGIA